MTRDGEKLFIQRGDGTKREIQATGRDTFTYAMAYITVRFSRDAKGKISGMLFESYHGVAEPEIARTSDPLPAEKQEAKVQ